MNLRAVLERSRAEREAWRYTDLTGVARQMTDVGCPKADDSGILSSVLCPPSSEPHLLFLNGVWQPEQSCLAGLPEGFVMQEADGVTISLGEQVCLVTAPVELLFVTTPVAQPTEITTRLQITLGGSARLTLIERHIVLGESSAPVAHMLDTQVTLGLQAKLVHGKMVKGGASSVHIAQGAVEAAKGAYYDQFTLLGGGKLTRNEMDVALLGEMAQCHLQGVMLARGAEHADTTTRIAHRAPHGTSRQVYRSVVDGKARAVFQGKIAVAEGAQKTDGHQLSRALLLSDSAEMDAKPELEIYADDVKCSHGSAVGDLDDEALFYLRARGIPEPQARALLIHAFVEELVEGIQVEGVREAVRREVEGWLSPQGQGEGYHE